MWKKFVKRYEVALEEILEYADGKMLENEIAQFETEDDDLEFEF